MIDALAHIGIGISAFIATNIDDLFCTDDFSFPIRSLGKYK